MTDHLEQQFGSYRTPQHALIGRKRELMSLGQLLQATQEQAGEQGTARAGPLERPYVSLLGDPGIGKTRLAEEVSLIARQRGWAIVWGRAHSHEQHMAYCVWIDILRNALAYDYWPRQEIVENPAHYQPLLDLLPELAESFPITSPFSSENREQAQFRIWEALQTLFVTISTHSPLLIVLDDLHWADSSSCNFLDYLVRNLANRNVLLLGTCREQEISTTHPLHSLFSRFQQQGLMTRMILPPLAEDQIGQLVAHLPPPIVKDIQQRAAGNPLFAEALARFPSQDDPLPPSITNVFEQHITHLSRDTQQMLGCAAVLGNAFSLHLLHLVQNSASSSQSKETLLNQLEEALQARLLTGEKSGTDILYHFWHPLLIEYLYHRLSAARRSRWHQRAAHVLQTTMGERGEVAATVVYHLVNGGAEPSLLAHYAKLAGDHAYKFSAFPEAEKHYQLSLHNGGDWPDSAHDKDWLQHAHLLECLGECTLILGKHTEARQCYKQALDLHEQQHFSTKEEEQYEAQLCALFWCEIGRTWRYASDNKKAEECLRQGELTLKRAEITGGPVWARLRAEQGHTCWANGNLNEALNRANEALKLSESFPAQKQRPGDVPFLTLTQRMLNGDTIGLGRIYTLLAAVEVTLGQSALALEHLKCALEIFEKNNSKNEIANISCNLADLYLRRSDYALAQPLLVHSYQLTKEIGSTPIMSVIASNLGILAARLGNLREAEAWYRQALLLTEQVNDLFYNSLFHSYIAMALIDQGKLDEAEELLLQAIKLSRTQHLTPCTDFALVTLGHLRIAQARTQSDDKYQYNRFLARSLRALQHALAFGEHGAETRVEGEVTLAEALWLQGALDIAQQQARAALEKAQKHELVWLSIRAQHLLGTILIASGKQQEGERYFLQAIEYLQDYGMRLERAQALRNCGTVLLQRGASEEMAYRQGRRYLEQAHALFLECDAQLDAEAVKQLLC